MRDTRSERAKAFSLHGNRLSGSQWSGEERRCWESKANPQR